MQDLDFTEKTVLVSGGGAGIGRAIAQAFGERGARLVIAEIDEQRCRAAREALAVANIEALVSATDVREREQVEQLMREVEQRFGGIDVLVNNVGDFCGVVKPFADCSDEDFEQLYSTNLRSMFLLTRAAIPLLRQRGPGGCIINLSSIEAFRGIPMATAYSAFKHAVTGFTRSLALELAPEGIRVNAVAPETTETEQVKPSVMVAPQHREHSRRWIPLGRFGTPGDAAGSALFLASELAAWVTGTTLNLDGGALAAAGWYRDPNEVWTNMPVVSDNGFGL